MKVNRLDYTVGVLRERARAERVYIRIRSFLRVFTYGGVKGTPKSASARRKIARHRRSRCGLYAPFESFGRTDRTCAFCGGCKNCGVIALIIKSGGAGVSRIYDGFAGVMNVGGSF